VKQDVGKDRLKPVGHHNGTGVGSVSLKGVAGTPNASRTADYMKDLLAVRNKNGKELTEAKPKQILKKLTGDTSPKRSNTDCSDTADGIATPLTNTRQSYSSNENFLTTSHELAQSYGNYTFYKSATQDRSRRRFSALPVTEEQPPLVTKTQPPSEGNIRRKAMPQEKHKTTDWLMLRFVWITVAWLISIVVIFCISTQRLDVRHG
jgi:hypothetical protein